MTVTKLHILKGYLNGCMDNNNKFFPYQIISFVATGSLPAKQNIRYFVKIIEHSSAGTVQAGATVDKVDITQNRVVRTVSQMTEPIVVTAVPFALDFNVNCLCDINTPVSITINCLSPFCQIVYAEIDEVPGEYVA